ncbi:LysR family transcriptional regulator [Roseovarius atlanticus]|uniref:LysR family transcriptional regulator n=1 Tax=Roseovarius atlanticus TaxID=1641875 RepID=A0A0T5NPK0_9RHOB|nr:LysR family transcriptional regulator [Roseovarius atlanticus]KRS10872.1 LysR family transcriptional regulator [Roseovarius atlanticus]
MAKSLPPLSWLRSFEAAARNLSFTTAAEEIGLTQSAVSQQVKSLESRLGVQLFIRHARGLALTDAGRRLLPEVDAPLQALSRAMVGMDTRPSRNLLTIASSISVAHWKIAPRLTEFRERFPQLEVRILSAIWPDDFHSTRADVEIRFGSAQQAGPEAEAILPNDLIALKAPTLKGDVADLPLIETVGTSSGWQAWSRQIEPVPDPSIYTDTYGMALHLAAHGNGVVLANKWLAQYALENALVTRAHSASIPSQEGYHLSVSSDKWQAEAFREWLLK